MTVEEIVGESDSENKAQVVCLTDNLAVAQPLDFSQDAMSSIRRIRSLSCLSFSLASFARRKKEPVSELCEWRRFADEGFAGSKSV